MSLKAEVSKLYKRGLIRDGVIKHAAEEAILIKDKLEFAKRAELAAMRAEVFGAYTPGIAKLGSMIDKLKQVWSGIPSPILAGVGVTAGLSGVSALGSMINKFKQAREFADTYEVMMEKKPDFKQKESLVREHFEVLKQFAPAMASNPTVASGYIQQAIEMGDIVPTDTIHKLTQTQKQYRESQPEGVLGTVVSGLAGDIKGVVLGAEKLLKPGDASG